MTEHDQTAFDSCSKEQLEKDEDEKLNKMEEKKKARLRSRGPYRKARADR